MTREDHAAQMREWRKSPSGLAALERGRTRNTTRQRERRRTKVAEAPGTTAAFRTARLGRSLRGVPYPVNYDYPLTAGEVARRYWSPVETRMEIE